ncbi:hypothetical protein [uncultured Bartonella sp.]|uniref:hypothetical protein n=1 Tax=uncultured Bartonella sp. TaxID=104108 RepID=UPI00261BBEFD|nr:hypothetical protein [uncultured Bartonella sp.]
MAIAFIFVWVFIEFERKAVANLTQIEKQKCLEDFRDRRVINQLSWRPAEYNDAIQKVEMDGQIAKDNVDRAFGIYQSAKEQFKNWIETRQITNDAAGDKEF